MEEERARHACHLHKVVLCLLLFSSRERICRPRTSPARRTLTCASPCCRTRSTGSRPRSSDGRSTLAGTRHSTLKVNHFFLLFCWIRTAASGNETGQHWRFSYDMRRNACRRGEEIVPSAPPSSAKAKSFWKFRWEFAIDTSSPPDFPLYTIPATISRRAACKSGWFLRIFRRKFLIISEDPPLVPCRPVLIRSNFTLSRRRSLSL